MVRHLTRRFRHSPHNSLALGSLKKNEALRFYANMHGCDY
jgi:hypothetical protein